MNRRVPLLCVAIVASAMLSACNGYDNPAGSKAGSIQVQIVQAPPAAITAGSSIGIVANVLYDTKNSGVTWSCAPAGACGSFNPTTTAYNVGTQYTAPTSGPAGALNVPITITATSVTDSSQSTSSTTLVQVATPALLQGQYAFVQQGYASFGIVGSVSLDGNGNVLGGEADFSSNCCGASEYPINPTSTTGISGYTVDATGHGKLTLDLQGCCVQTSSITLTSTSHALLAEDDQFNGLTLGGTGSLDLQSAGPTFSAAQVSGGYSFTMTGFSGVPTKADGKGTGLNGSWAGIFTADGTSGITGGVYDNNFAGGAAPNFTSTPFSGSFTSPDTYGRGTLTFTGVNGGSDASFTYYIVTPEVLRLTVQSPANSYAGVTGSAFGQGAVQTTTAALSGSFVVGDFGFDAPSLDSSGNEVGGNAMGAAGQFTTDGKGNISAGIMDLNDSATNGVIAGTSWAGSSYSISGSPRGTITGPSGQTYNVYLTDPNLNLLDPNNSTGTGGALWLETDAAYSTIGVLIPQSNSSASLQGIYGLMLSDQANPPNSDGGYTGSFAATAGVFSGEGDFQGSGTNNATPILGPLGGTFVADSGNPGHFTGTITTTPAFPNAKVGSTTAGGEQVSYYLANASQGFIVETDTVAPVTGVVEAQPSVTSAKDGESKHKAYAPRSLGRTSNRQAHPGNPH
jgi:hypothetical protein